MIYHMLPCDSVQLVRNIMLMLKTLHYEDLWQSISNSTHIILAPDEEQRPALYIIPFNPGEEIPASVGWGPDST
jgi:hypothetical protein